MKFKAIIVGVRDFKSSKGNPLRQIFVTADRKQEGLIGQATYMIWQFQTDDYFSADQKKLLGAECICMDASGKILLLQVTGIDA